MEPEAVPGEVLSGTRAMHHYSRTRRRHSRGGFCLDTEETAGSPGLLAYSQTLPEK